MVRLYFFAISFASSRYPCQIPKLDAGQPTFVLFVHHEPIPGLTRIDASVFGKSSPYVLS